MLTVYCASKGASCNACFAKKGSLCDLRSKSKLPQSITTCEQLRGFSTDEGTNGGPQKSKDSTDSLLASLRQASTPTEERNEDSFWNILKTAASNSKERTPWKSPRQSVFFHNPEKNKGASQIEKLFESLSKPSRDQKGDDKDQAMQEKAKIPSPLDDLLSGATKATGKLEDGRDITVEKSSTSTLHELFSNLMKTTQTNEEARKDEELDREKRVPFLDTIGLGSDDTFEQLKDWQPRQSIPLADLKYTDFYPRRVHRWVLDAKTPKGYFDEWGVWQTAGQTITVLEQELKDSQFSKMNIDLKEDEVKKEEEDVDVAHFTKQLKKILRAKGHPVDDHDDGGDLDLDLEEFAEPMEGEDNDEQMKGVNAEEGHMEELKDEHHVYEEDDDDDDDDEVVLADEEEANEDESKDEPKGGSYSSLLNDQPKTKQKHRRVVVPIFAPPPNQDLIKKLGKRTEEGFAEELRELPADLQNAYRFGVKPEEIEGKPLKLRELLSFKNATIHEVNTFRKHQLIRRWARFPGDTGSSEVQIALLTEQINHMQEHMLKNHKDYSCQRRLEIKTNQRKRLMRYLKRTNGTVYAKLLKELNVEDIGVPLGKLCHHKA